LRRSDLTAAGVGSVILHAVSVFVRCPEGLKEPTAGREDDTRRLGLPGHFHTNV
jgi:hypothetical protein